MVLGILGAVCRTDLERLEIKVPRYYAEVRPWCTRMADIVKSRLDRRRYKAIDAYTGVKGFQRIVRCVM
jgi:hypothetical protein